MLGSIFIFMQTKTYQVGVASVRIIGAVCGAFFLMLCVFALRAGAIETLPIFGFFTLMGLYLYVSVGVFEISEAAIAQRNLFGHFRILWSEVRRIEAGSSAIVLHGEDKRFVLATPEQWSGPEKPEAFECFRLKVEEIGVIVYPSNAADLKIHKNVRVRDRAA
ncbi:MAG: hypothetical protein JNK38_20785 [Acidobacteria bacterium]|nr:hypothetical protein [Acidobacteriota bacterium]